MIQPLSFLLAKNHLSAMHSSSLVYTGIRGQQRRPTTLMTVLWGEQTSTPGRRKNRGERRAKVEAKDKIAMAELESLGEFEELRERVRAGGM